MRPGLRGGEDFGFCNADIRLLSGPAAAAASPTAPAPAIPQPPLASSTATPPLSALTINTFASADAGTPARPDSAMPPPPPPQPPPACPWCTSCPGLCDTCNPWWGDYRAFTDGLTRLAAGAPWLLPGMEHVLQAWYDWEDDLPQYPVQQYGLLAPEVCDAIEAARLAATPAAFADYRGYFAALTAANRASFRLWLDCGPVGPWCCERLAGLLRQYEEGLALSPATTGVSAATTKAVGSGISGAG